MKPIKKIFAVLGTLSVLFFALLILLPIIYKDELVEEVKRAANHQIINAELTFEDASISLIKHFPKVMVTLSDVHIIGKADFEGQDLFKSEELSIDFDLRSVIHKDTPPTIHSVTLDGATLSLLAEESGLRNFDIIPPSQEGHKNDSALVLDIEDVIVLNSRFSYLDESNNTLIQSSGINMTGSATLRGDQYEIKYEGELDQNSLKTSGIKYLNGAHALVNGIVSLDIGQSKYTLGETDLKINDLDLLVDGWVQMTNAILMDISFESKNDAFKKLWSLIPVAYTEDYSQANILGTMGVEGYVRGTYDSERNQLPSFNIRLKAYDGKVSYPDMPKTITGINTDVTVRSSGSLSDLELNIPQFNFKIDDRPFEGKLAVKNVRNNPNVNMEVNGSIDLSTIPQVIPLNDINTLSGILDADAQIVAKLSDIESKSYSNTLISGSAKLEGFELAMIDRPKITLSEVKSIFSPERIEFKNLRGKLGETNFVGDASIDNVVALCVPGQKVTGILEWQADYLDLNKWMTTAIPSDPSGDKSSFDVSLLPDNYALEIKGNIDRLIYDNYDIRDMSAHGQMRNGDLNIDRISSRVDKSDFSIQGQLNNVLGFLLNDDMLTGEMRFNSTYLDLNYFMQDQVNGPMSTNSIEEDLHPIVIPSNIDIDVITNIKKLTYDNLDVEQISGLVKVSEGEARMEDVDAQALDGSFTMNGGYTSAKGTEAPSFDLAYTIKKFDYTKTFDKVNTFRFLAPVAKFIQGNFNSTLKMSGRLGEDLMPNLKSINAEGAVETFNGLLSEFGALSKINEYFNLDALSKMKLEQTKNFFSVENGTVTIKEFAQDIKDIGLKISGTHTLDQEINYLIKAKVPKEYLSETGLVQLADKGLAAINTQINKLGLNIDNGQFVNLNFLLTGTITDPKVSVKVVGMDGKTDITNTVKESINTAIEEVKDSIKTTINTKIDTLEAKAEEKRDVLIDTATSIIDAQLDSVKADVRQKVDSLLIPEVGGVIPDTLKTRIDSLLLKGGNKEVEKVKDILKDINIFNKKKKKTWGGN